MNLTITKSYSNGAALTEAMLDSIKSSIETFFNVTGLDTDNINNDSIGSEHLASSSVTTSKITNTSITPDKLAASLRQRLAVTGSIMLSANGSLPSGYLECDGSAVSRSTYAALYAVIGTTYGSGNGSTTFNVPDLRGRFFRGVDGGSGNDPDASSRTAMNSGGNTGDNVGSVQAIATARPTTPFTHSAGGAHTHSFTVSGALATGAPQIVNRRSGSPNQAKTTSSSGTHTHELSGGDTDTHPINANIAAYIKV